MDSEAKEWICLDGEKEKIGDVQPTILGRLSVVDKALIVTVNSIKRAEAVQKYLKDLLDNLYWKDTPPEKPLNDAYTKTGGRA
nr:hypothetical protein [Candidatus Hamiltonella defensa]